MTTDDVSIRDIIPILERNVNVLKLEAHGSDIDIKFRDTLELFNVLSCNLTIKFQSLFYLSENYICPKNFKQCINRFILIWKVMKNKAFERRSKVQMISHTQSEMPLSLLLEKIKQERLLTRKLLCTHEAKYSDEYLAKCYVLLNEIDDLIRNLERSDDKLRQYKATSDLNRFLVKLDTIIDEYVSTSEISLIDKSKCEKLDAFPIVAKLLTGELLNDEIMDPKRVLAENIPKKPVFIIKVKRKTDIPSMVVEEMM
ncbi:hypothetical protein PUN28_013894 [Cardiocondyla obscurior]|uniref:Uncharacterized protein n=1 Tax=Cardiocondyla obscurior TaxID=286306 RepID=A0AAW2F6W6_9HYME